jgi:hypothetical protein
MEKALAENSKPVLTDMVRRYVFSKKTRLDP